MQFGQANALLAGDALLLRAFEVIAENSALAPAVALEAVRILAHASGIDGMVGGQTIDLAYENQQASAEVLHTMHLLKTGALIQASCQMGAVAASASTVEFQAITEYAKSLGLAFQICDDILNVTGNQEQMGKPVGNDQQQQKTNFISVYGLERSQQLAREWTDQAKHALEPFAQNGFLLWMTDQLLHRQN